MLLVWLTCFPVQNMYFNIGVLPIIGSNHYNNVIISPNHTIITIPYVCMYVFYSASVYNVWYNT